MYDAHVLKRRIMMPSARAHIIMFGEERLRV